MISPADMGTIQVEITNSCIHHCSNCTRFCGLHEKNFMMSMDEFRKAVDSLKDFKGIIGVMGGEPTLNPHFPEMIQYLHEVRPEGKKSAGLLAPTKDFNQFHQSNWNDTRRARRGLWSALGNRYYENLEAISDIFPYQCLNDHKNTGLHQALLIPRKELGISDEEWIPLRDACWIQNEWSASITPKGAFFCEIAAALDMLFDGPGGWPVEPDWWKRTPEEFGDQLHWCEMCSAALAVPRIEGNLETDFVSPAIWEKLKNRKAWKIINNRCCVFDTDHYDKSKYTINKNGVPYLSDNDIRVSQDTGNTLFPHEIKVLSADGVTPPQGSRFQQISKKDASDLKFTDWLMILNENIPEKTVQYIENAVFNPGVLYFADGGNLIFINRRASALRNCSVLPLKIKDLKKLYSKKKRYNWSNWKAPEKPSLHELWLKLSHRLSDSWHYRTGVILQKLFSGTASLR